MRTKPVEAIRPLTIKRRRLKVKTEGVQAKLEREGEAERERERWRIRTVDTVQAWQIEIETEVIHPSSIQTATAAAF